LKKFFYGRVSFVRRMWDCVYSKFC
jgi:hypothetical protein